MDWVLGKVVDQSDCGASFGNRNITDLVFADVAVIFDESLDVLVMALDALQEEAKPLGLKVSWLKTKVQVFGGLLDETVQSVHACGEDIEILESFTYLGSAVHNDGGSRQEVLRRIGIAHGIMNSLSRSIWRCRYLCRRTKIRIFKSLVIPVLHYGCETWTLNSDLKRRIDASGPTATEGTNSTRLFNKMGKELESWCSEKQRNKLLEQAMFPALSHADWVDVFVRYNTAIPSSAAVERLFAQGSDIMKRERV
ncbi:putative uncharacterized transposon-derived protein F52C9.6 [Chionoecetes opilio]|uniref:Uncharacterized transposon-derived protein F52C9.6 n=1 Tax=Chionoecetes opilio TaxID=41210 RepID=A0A8J5CL27_CHIOP|nr:putative uncharacterized transposon-derived protein F52C9.6 [Chionoecetes opilio]